MRPYLATFAARFQLMLQYRAAALAGFVTQCWFGSVKIMVYAAFYGASTQAAANASISLPQVITYTWLSQGLLTLSPWSPDPDVGASVRSGGVSLDRLRPVDAYGLWFVRSAAWMISRAIPRMILLAAFAAVILPLVGLGDWALKPPPTAEAAGLFLLSLVLMILLSSAIMMLLNIIVAATLNDRGANVLITPLTIVLSGNLMPLALYPDSLRTFLLVQPFAGVLDIPAQIYVGSYTGAEAWTGLALQAFWIFTLILAGHAWMERVMARLEVQGG